MNAIRFRVCLPEKETVLLQPLTMDHLFQVSLCGGLHLR